MPSAPPLANVSEPGGQIGHRTRRLRHALLMLGTSVHRNWASPDFPDTFLRCDDDSGGVLWRRGRSWDADPIPRSSSSKQSGWSVLVFRRLVCHATSGFISTS